MSVDEWVEGKSSFTFLWKIKNISMSPRKDFESKIMSPIFTSELMNNSEFQLQLDPNCKGTISLDLSCIKDPPANFEFEWFFKKKDGMRKTSNNFSEMLNQYMIPVEYCGLYLVNRDSFLEEVDLEDDTLTLGVYVEGNTETSFAEKWIAITEIHAKRLSMTFPFSFGTSQKQEMITIPLASDTGRYPDFKIVLKCSSSIHTAESIIIRIEMAKSSFPVFAKYKVSFQDAKDNIKYFSEDEHWFEANNEYETLELKNFILEQESLGNSDFTLHCNLAVTDGTHTTTTESLNRFPPGDELAHQSHPDCPKKHSSKDNFKCLYEDKESCDFVLFVEGEKFPVHKTVLGAVSPVFCAIFEQEKKKETSSLIIDDIDAGTVKRLINYAYKKSTDDLDWEEDVKLFSAANKFQILDLKQTCRDLIKSKLSIENVIDIRSFADLHQDSYIREETYKFIYSNSEELFKTEKWNFFAENNEDVATDLMDQVNIDKYYEDNEN